MPSRPSTRDAILDAPPPDPALDPAGCLQYVTHEIERARLRSSFLAEAARVLSSSFDVDARLADLARLAVPMLADGCVVDLVGEDGALRRVAVAHVDPDTETLLRVLDRPPAAMPGASPETAAAAAAPRAVAAIPRPGEARARGGLDPGRRRLLREVGSVLVVPIAAAGRALGTCTCIRARGGAYGPQDLALLQDVCGRIAMALENARLYREAQEANRRKDEFLSWISHELRTPLNAILGWAHLLGTGRLEAGRRDHAIAAIERNARAQCRLLGDLRDFSRLRAGQLRLDPQRVAVAAIVERAATACARPAEARQVRIEVAADPGIEVFGDPRRLQRVFEGLIANAIRFSYRGGRVDVEARRTGEQAIVAVRDHGVGIPADLVLRLLPPRGGPADAGAADGAGLGLAVTRRLVELHGGELAAASEGEHRGATFTVSLPLAGRVDEAVADAGGEPEPGLAGLTILAVDDDPGALDLLRTLLEERGGRVRTAGSARAALRGMPAARPDVLLVDLGMEEEDGCSMLRRLRRRPAARGGRIPAIALTAYAGDEDRERALAAGFQLHVAKPVEPDLLVRAIQRVARPRR